MYQSKVWVSLTGFQSAPVDILKEGLILELGTLIIFKPKSFQWVLHHQAFTKVLTIFTKSWSVIDGIIYDSACHFVIFNLKKKLMSIFGLEQPADFVLRES